MQLLFRSQVLFIFYLFLVQALHLSTNVSKAAKQSMGWCFTFLRVS